MSQNQIASTTKISLLFASILLISVSSGQDANSTNYETVTASFKDSVNLTCRLQAGNLKNYTWTKLNGPDNSERLNELTSNQKIDEKQGTLILENVEAIDNGTYECSADNGTQRVISNARINVMVNGYISDCTATPLMIGWTHLKWKVNENKDVTLKLYSFHYAKSNTDQWSKCDANGTAGISSYILHEKKLENGGNYKLGIQAVNNSGVIIGECIIQSYTALKEDFVPVPKIDGSTNTSITISWPAPNPAERREFFNYKIQRTVANKKSLVPSHENLTPNNRTIKDLEPDTEYSFNVQACVINETDSCGNWSTTVKGHTSKNESNISADLRPSGIINLLAAIIAFSFYSFK